MDYSEINDIELLELLLAEEGIQQETELGVISRRSLSEAPVSFQQRRLWFLYELEPTSSAYNICSVFSLKGRLRIEALQWAFQELQQRHEILRTIFLSVDGEAQQIIHPHVLTEIIFEDGSDSQQEILNLARLEAEHTFNLETGPLIRFRVFCLTPEQYILTLTLHHIIADAWSIGVILQEIIALYEISLKKESIKLPDLKIQYADYAAWQQEKMNGLALAESLTYWEKQLAELPILQFPVDFTRPRLQTFRGDLVTFQLPSKLEIAIREFSHKQGTTLFMTLMAAFASLLSRYSGQEDIPIGTSIANRPEIETEKLIGFFVNMLVIRNDLSNKPSFRTVLNRVKSTVLEAFQYAEVPFETLVERLHLERDTSRNPLFQIAFTLLNAPKANVNLTDLEISIIATQEAARFDLELFITENPESLQGVLSYNRDLFRKETIERFARHFCKLIENLVAQPDTPVDRVPFLSPEELASLIPTQPKEIFPVTSCLHEIFRQQVKLRPQQTALIFEQQTLSYEQLNHQANQLAHHLINLGIKLESRVGLWLSRSIDLVIAILAILKVGGVYVPFDPDYPSDRIAYMLEDSQVAVLLTHTEFLSSIPDHTATVVFIDNCKAELATASIREPEVFVHPDNAAYIIYTSGSTGQPKGVVVTHRHVVRLMLATEKWFQFHDRDVWTLFHSYAFDFSVWEMWGALFFGGRLVIVPYLVSRSPEEFYQLLCDAKVTVLNQTPSAFRQLMQAEELISREGELELRYVIFGGEALDLASLEPWFDRHDEEFPLLVNMYGITETTVHVTYRPIRLRDVKQRLGSLIGKPIPDLSIYILDAYGQPVPVGVVGEMYVGGAGVTRGYFNRPQLTAERMIPNPFVQSMVNHRLYKTGDLARYLNNGEVEYIGRNDHQVKIRGFRIELGEIEAVIKRHSGVRDALVIVREESQEDIRIAAYVIPQNQSQSSAVLTREQTQEWQYTFNETYRDSDSEINSEAFNIIGWNSSYDNQPISAEEMRQWLNNTLIRIEALKPNRVLEIGCGTGMILFKIAPQVQSYWGTDFSQEAINRLKDIIHKHSCSQVYLLHKEAIDFSEIPEAYFDTVIINSVAQYFPSIEYLQQVISGALQVLVPGGRLFIGDNRSLPLLKYFYSSIAFYQADDTIDRKSFQNQIQRFIEEENELVIDPNFFVNLTDVFPIAAVEIHLKEESNYNELTKYRYDVVLHKSGTEDHDFVEVNWEDWEISNSDLSDLKKRIISTDTIGWRLIPNKRLIQDEAIYQWMEGYSHENSIRELRSLIEHLDVEKAVDPSYFYGLAKEIGRGITISYSQENHRCFDVCFYQITSNKRRLPIMPITQKSSSQATHGDSNDPLKGRLVKTFISQLKEQVRQQLPEYMCPASFVLLESFPITPSGKLDRRALPAPKLEFVIDKQAFVEPKTSTQARLCKLWIDVLGIDRIGITDDFFHLGGHSLLATKLVSRIREEFNVALPLRKVFEAPTIASLADAIESLGDNTPPDIIPVIENKENLPLSFSQTRLWFLDLLQPNNPAYNIAIAFRLEGDLNLEALQQSLQLIVERHEVLRTTFESYDGIPRQVIHKSYQVPLTVIQLNDEALKLAVREEIVRPFHLGSLPLLRVHGYQLAANTHVFVLVIHHIVSDGWSLGVMVKELSSFYTALCLGDNPSLPPLPIQYGDFAHWQRTAFAQTKLQEQLAFWKDKLGGEREVLELPTDYPRSANPLYQGRAVSFTINQEIATQFQKLCESQGATLFMGLLGVFSILLMRYSSQEDLLIGIPIANRNRKEIEGLIGFFVNTLVIRSDLSGNPDFLTLLLRLKEETLQAYANQDVPFEKVVEEIQPERSLNHNPLFQVMFVLQNAPMGKLDLPNLQLTPLELEQTTAKFDLTLLMSETQQGLQGQWEYRSDLFDEATINRMVGHFETLLENIVASPKQPITELTLLTEVEQHQLLVKWNDTQIEYPQDKCIHQLFEAQVEQTPDAVAVVYETERLTYRELNRRSNQLAHYLQSLDVTTDTLVGLCVDRSIEMIVGLLGILKAGGAYVPLDPEYPEDRLNFMLHDSQVKVLLTQQRFLELLPQHQMRIICLDREWQVISQWSNDNPCTLTKANHLAYLIYTSGSTGQPKGVMISHRSLCNHTFWMQTEFCFTANDKVLQKTPFGFDASVHEFYSALLVGGQLLLARSGGHTDPDYLLKYIAEEKITTVQFVPSLLQVLVEHKGIETCNSLQRIFCGGEVLPVSVSKDLLSKLDVNLYNLYGPTEACIDSTFWNCRQEIPGQVMPIGRPIANAQIYILDAHLQPVPIGVPGELYIGGAGVARGYLNRPELTGEKFIPNPFSSNSDSRLYKTGDLVRYLPNGNIEFLGRRDNQVKIRGFRIELGEIESVLLQFPQVLNAVVMTCADSSGGDRLIAYLVAKEKHLLSPNILRDFLKRKLPDFMLPSNFVILDSFPLTPNGKVDKKALSTLKIERNINSNKQILPRTPLEYKLLGIWQEILPSRSIGITENFFDLGGHSLLAIRLIAAIEKRLDYSLPVVSLFREGTIEKIAALLEATEKPDDLDVLIPLQSQGNLLPLFLVHQAGGYALSYSLLAQSLGQERPIYALQAQGLDGRQPPLETIPAMATSYLKAIRQVFPDGPYLLGGHSLGGLIAFEMAYQLEAVGEKVENVLIIDTHPPLPTPEVATSLQDDAGILCFMVEQIGIHFHQNVAISYEELSSLEKEAQFEFVEQVLRQSELIPPDLGRDFIAGLVNVYKTNVQASLCYQPQSITSRISFFKTRSLAEKFPEDRTAGWGSLTTQQVSVYDLTGEHQTILTEPHVKKLAVEILAATAQSPHPNH
ncbi:Non-ribosomal peptide synthase involved in Hassallidin biosynthesis [Planktothrix serta PCC 8927]|uniref:Non-ribosomal peptide synthase involved in Hassallidin biosynthesis n=1 Tax=Planktothrix serta PCC 8927 TaxID=671068 RepID=A0A1J1JM90_9CYAN|nr:non-ribosomal peptide synthetase [Planktothrix serta]CZT62794.1 Non-ribosomal peptide synthase involved in Hassallidin biosynthesis [Planktothrix serta PCC 8927]VXD10569.1 Non-ribosomal peptide synthase involved in Hassallidin biosynthesis [Planktothrix serta PCC 8927]